MGIGFKVKNYIFGSLFVFFAIILFSIIQNISIIIFGLFSILFFIFGHKGYFNEIYRKSIIILISVSMVTLISVFFYFLAYPTGYSFAISLISIVMFMTLYISITLIVGRENLLQFDKGVKLFDQGQYQESFDFFNRILNRDSSNPLAWAGKSLALSRMGKDKETLKAAEHALNLRFEMELDPVAKRSNVITLFIVSTVHFNLKNYKEALKYLDECLKLNNKNIDAWNLKGALLIELGESERALKYLNKAMKFNPGSAVVLNNKGYALSKMGKYQEAMDCIDKALKINSNTPEFWLTKGEIFVNLEKNGQALEFIEKALELDPDNEDAKKFKDELLLEGKNKY